MKGEKITLRRQFLFRVLSILLMIALLSGITQLYFINNQIKKQSDRQAESVADNVIRSLKQTNFATSVIESQIDLKLVAQAKHIASLLKEKESGHITQKDLLEIRDQLGLSGISIFKETPEKDDYVAIRSTEEKEIGFSLKEYGYYEAGKALASGEKPDVPFSTFTDTYTLVLPIAQAGSLNEEPQFFKFAYYYVKEQGYAVSPFIEANEVKQYMESVGPGTEIEKIVKKSDIVEEIAIINRNVFENPALESQFFPPMKKIEAGTFQYASKKDSEIINQLTRKKTFHIEKSKGKNLYKMFIPTVEDRLIYIALDYDQMSGPLYRHSVILIISGIGSLFILFLLTARFFNRIYENLQIIKRQVSSLENGDLKAKSRIDDGSELELLSQDMNSMVDTLNQLVTDTQTQAMKVQKLSILLESEASDSVQKMYSMSTEATLRSREQLNEILELLNGISGSLTKKNNSPQVVLERIESLQELARNRTAATTDTTIKLSDLVQSLHSEAQELSEISIDLLNSIKRFRV
ncbi:methyl-accepting chemotaxis protein [Rossellomorea vietnamensis]|uniref:Methyl-accepting chemotaxis protein n=1 Tax=Rossellomorea vietnamensis TaxID=218284 RepID=A0A5D4MB82_9BACI|nr:methyl-accepting chemotaxis protein [Rossellomorea vietnamensis]TYR98851.1 methyl-accepting chemotaxis protein [Rossellomorea vietnamensis]